MQPPIPGNLVVGGNPEMVAGFFPARFDFLHGGRPAHISRSEDLSKEATQLITRLQGGNLQQIERVGTIMDVAHDLGATLAQLRSELTRAVTSTTTGFPIRENLEAPAKILTPTETPIRNMLPRVPGAGLVASWRQITSLGGGYGFQTTVTTGASSATQTVGSTVGMRAGDILWLPPRRWPGPFRA